jgi:hypothetical protein
MASRNRRRRSSRQGTPARLSERIIGSARNAAETAASRSSADDIILTPDLLAALKRKVESHNATMRSRRSPEYRLASLPMLKAVLRRGMGAFSVSHRPNVSSRQQWGLARVNAFLRLLSTGRPLDPKYVSDNDLLPTGHERHSGAKGAPGVPEHRRLPVRHSLDLLLDTKSRSLRRLSAAYDPNPSRITRRARLLSEPFDANARDGDGDKIVQEGTIWERPAGTHWVTQAGERIEDAVRGGGRRKGDRVPAHLYHPSMRLVDKHGKTVDYTPTWAGESIGYRTSRRLGPTIGTGLTTPSRVSGPNAPSTPRRDVSTPHRLGRFSTEARMALVRLFNRGLPPIQREREEVDEKTGETRTVKYMAERPGSRYSPKQATERLLRLLEHVSSRRDDPTHAAVWNAGRHWYEQQHYAMQRMAKRHDVDFRLAVAVLAATSPRNPWDQWAKDRRKIVALAEREGISVQEAAKQFETEVLATPNMDVADFLLGNWTAMQNEDFDLSDEFIENARRALKNAPKQLAEFELSLKDDPSRKRPLGRLLGSTGDKPTDLEYKLAGIVMSGRAYEAQDHNVTYLSSMVANALEIIDGGPDQIDELLNGPKARSFYDNIAFFNQSDAITIDSIMAQLITGLNAEQAGELVKAMAVKLTGGATAARDRFGKNRAGYGVYAVMSEILHDVTDQWNEAHPNDMLSPTDVQAILWYIQREHTEIIDLLNKGAL